MRSYDVSLYEYLKKLNLKEGMINKIVLCFSVRRYKKNEHFISSNEVSNKIGFVVNGLFLMSIIQQDGTEFIKEFYKSNQFLLASYDTQKESQVNIVAIKDSIILEAKYSDIQILYNEYHDMEAISKKRMESEVELIYKRMTQYAVKTAKERYILFKEEYSDVEAEIPQYLIASYLGITPTQLSRIRSELKII